MRILMGLLVMMFSVQSFAIPKMLNCTDKNSSLSTGVRLAFLGKGKVWAAFSGSGSAPISGSVSEVEPSNLTDVSQIKSLKLAHGMIDTCKITMGSKRKIMDCQQMGLKELNCEVIKASASE
ncbi:MAG: hypothetical protein V4736_09310 [Bdellovibrionota bacterium]